MQRRVENRAVGWRAVDRQLRWSALVATVTLVLFAPPAANAQTTADSVAYWTRIMQVGPTLAARDQALAYFKYLVPRVLPAETQRVLIAELDRVHRALKAGTDVGAPGEIPEAFDEYYETLVLLVGSFETRESDLALLSAVAVSGGVSRRVVQLGDTAVALLVQQLHSATEADEHIALFQSLGLAWFWADSTGRPLSDRSRAQITAALTTGTLSGAHGDMLGVDLALQAIRDPAFLPLAQKLHAVAATRGVLGRSTEVSTRLDRIPGLTALAAARSTASLAYGLVRLVTAVCGSDAMGRRHGACQSLANEVAAASDHLAHGRTTPARNGFEAVGKQIDQAYAAGAFSDAEHALLAGNVTMVLQRLTP